MPRKRGHDEVINPSKNEEVKPPEDEAHQQPEANKKQLVVPVGTKFTDCDDNVIGTIACYILFGDVCRLVQCGSRILTTKLRQSRELVYAKFFNPGQQMANVAALLHSFRFLEHLVIDDYYMSNVHHYIRSTVPSLPLHLDLDAKMIPPSVTRITAPHFTITNMDDIKYPTSTIPAVPQLRHIHAKRVVSSDSESKCCNLRTAPTEIESFSFTGEACTVCGRYCNCLVGAPPLTSLTRLEWTNGNLEYLIARAQFLPNLNHLSITPCLFGSSGSKLSDMTVFTSLRSLSMIGSTHRMTSIVYPRNLTHLETRFTDDSEWDCLPASLTSLHLPYVCSFHVKPIKFSKLPSLQTVLAGHAAGSVGIKSVDNMMYVGGNEYHRTNEGHWEDVLTVLTSAGKCTPDQEGFWFKRALTFSMVSNPAFIHTRLINYAASVGANRLARHMIHLSPHTLIGMLRYGDGSDHAVTDETSVLFMADSLLARTRHDCFWWFYLKRCLRRGEYGLVHKILLAAREDFLSQLPSRNNHAPAATGPPPLREDQFMFTLMIRAIYIHKCTPEAVRKSTDGDNYASILKMYGFDEEAFLLVSNRSTRFAVRKLLAVKDEVPTEIIHEALSFRLPAPQMRTLIAPYIPTKKPYTEFPAFIIQATP